MPIYYNYDKIKIPFSTSIHHETFSVAIRQEDDTFYAQVPDLPDIHVIGDSIADTIDKVRSTLIGYLQKLADDGSDLPQPENITNHLTNPKFAGQTWAIISLNSMLFNSKQKSFNLHLPVPYSPKSKHKSAMMNTTLKPLF